MKGTNLEGLDTVESIFIIIQKKTKFLAQSRFQTMPISLPDTNNDNKHCKRIQISEGKGSCVLHESVD